MSSDSKEDRPPEALVERAKSKPEVGPTTGASPTLPVLPPPPGRWLYRIIIGTSVLIFGAASTMFRHRIDVGAVVTFSAFVLSGLTHLGIGLFGLRTGPGTQLVNAASNQVSLGRFDVAEALLARAERHHGTGVVMRGVHLVRAAIALRRGNSERARDEADLALARTSGVFTRRAAWSHRLEALAIRGFANAVIGDADRARADIAEVREKLQVGLPWSVMNDTPTLLLGGARTVRAPLARALLAEAILLAREGDRGALRAHLERHHELLVDSTAPSERALVRGLERMLATPTSTPYRRKNAERVQEGADGDADWVERVLPDVAPFVSSGTRAHAQDGALTGLDDPSRVTHLAKPPPDWSSVKRIGAMVGAWSIMMAAFAVVWVRSAHHASTSSTLGLIAATVALPAMFLLALIAFVGVKMRAMTLRRHALGQAFLRLATAEGGLSADDERRLEDLAVSQEPLILAQARLALAQLANRAGRFEEALDHGTRGLQPFRRSRFRAIGSEALLPALMAERALANAALGHVEDALSEVGAITEDASTRARAVFSVKLVALMHDGHIDEARALVAETSLDTAFDPPIEALMDIVRATDAHIGLGLADRARLREDLSGDSALRNWLSRATPEALRAFDELDAAPVGQADAQDRIRFVANDARGNDAESIRELRADLATDVEALRELAAQQESESQVHAPRRVRE